MNRYSVHLYGDTAKDLECRDIEVHAETPSLAETYALERYPAYDAVRVQSIWNNEKGDWKDFI